MDRTRYLFWLTAALLVSSGCRAWHNYRTVTVLVRDAETREPIDGARVRLGYFLLVDPFAPKRMGGFTGPDGTVDLVAAPYEGRAVLFASAAGYFSQGMQSLDDEVILACDPDRRQPRNWVIVEMYAEPAALVELVVPNGFQGLIRIEVQEDHVPGVARPRTFKALVPPSGRVQLTGPRLLLREEGADFRLRWADGTVLASPPEGAAVGYWRLDSAGALARYFFVGSQKDHDDCYRLYHKETPDGGWEFDPQAAEARMK